MRYRSARGASLAGRAGARRRRPSFTEPGRASFAERASSLSGAGE
ncbi:hypothetical protein HMPREF0185_01188 [Brevundimonas diminuta 470-4]|nr:hypothetical protein HMPREF0185_01188 [Brevundimonas diminuta 470-4]